MPGSHGFLLHEHRQTVELVIKCFNAGMTSTPGGATIQGKIILLAEYLKRCVYSIDNGLLFFLGLFIRRRTFLYANLNIPTELINSEGLIKH